MFKKYNFKIFRCNPNDPKFGLFKFVGKINLHLSKLREKKNKIKTANEVINKITKNFEKTVAVAKSKELQRYAKRNFIKLQKMENMQSEIKPIKIGKRPGTTYCFGCHDVTHNFRPQEAKMTN